MRLKTMLLAAGLVLASSSAFAGPLAVDMKPAATNPATPQMGDHLEFSSVIRNTGTKAIDGVIAWISLVQVDKGKEQPVDLEDWSAHKAVAEQVLAPGASIETKWPMRLIQSGHYRVVVSAVSRDGTELTPSQFADFAVKQKPVVESARVLPVAFGVPAIMAVGFFLAWRRRAH